MEIEPMHRRHAQAGNGAQCVKEYKADGIKSGEIKTLNQLVTTVQDIVISLGR